MTLDLVEHLRGLPSFGELGDEHLRTLATAMEVKTFPDGHPFIEEGSHGHAVYFLLRGEVEIVARKKDAEEFHVHRTVGAPEILGLVALIDHGPRTATCRARGEVTAAAFPLEGADLLVHSPGPVSCAFLYALALQLVGDASALNDALVESLRRGASPA